MLSVQDEELIRRLFLSPSGFLSPLESLRLDLRDWDRTGNVLEAWDVMVAYIQEAEAEKEA